MSLMITGEEPRFVEMNEVIELYIKNVNPTKIAKEVGIRRVDVLEHIDNWKRTAVGSEAMKDRVDELISTMDEHYSMLIQKAYEVIDEVDRPLDEDSKRKETMTRSQMLSQKMNAIKTIADLESKRIDVLQKSGLLEAADVGDQLAEMEAEMEKVMEILDSVLCDECHPKVLGALAKDNDTVIVVHGE